MYSKKFAVIALTVMLVVSMWACGDKTVETGSDVEGTTAAAYDNITQQSTTDSATKSSEKSATEEELSSKAEEIKASMAAVIEQASREAESKAEEEKKEAQSREEAAKAEVEAQIAAAKEAVSQIADEYIGADSEVVTVVDTYGVESARRQYVANYNVYEELVRLTNELRASLGVGPLAMDENICIASCKKAVDYYIADYYDGPNHTMIDGRRWQALFEDFNIVATARAENLASGSSFKTAKDMFEGWKNSPVHYENMVNPKYTRVGVGSCGYVWFMDLAN